MLLEDLRGIFTIIFPNKKGVARSSKESLVNTLMTAPEKLALLAAALEIDGAAPQESDLAQLTALRARLPGPAARSAPEAAGSPAPHPGPDPPPPRMQCSTLYSNVHEASSIFSLN
jgi:hypothetical protein